VLLFCVTNINNESEKSHSLLWVQSLEPQNHRIIKAAKDL